MTNSARAFMLSVVICIVLFAYTTDGQYSSRYDEIDIEEVLNNPRLRNQYVRCVLNTGPCVTGPMRFLKEKYAEAFLTKCKMCTEKQVIFFDKIADWFTKHEPKTWERAVNLAIEETQRKHL